MKKTTHLFLLLISVFTLFFTSCDTSPLEPDSEVFGYQYFPLETGQFTEYEIEETTYTVLDPPKTTNYLLRETVADSFVDGEGDIAFRIKRFRRETSLDAWELDSVWAAKRTPSQAIRIENNQTFIRLVFPVEKDKEWNGNAFNALGEDAYAITRLDKSQEINSQTFDATLEVVQANDSSAVSLDKRSETYAEDIGLIYKNTTQLVYCTEPDCIGQGIISSGKTLTQKIIVYGKE